MACAEGGYFVSKDIWREIKWMRNDCFLAGRTIGYGLKDIHA
jgi:hypothetical protein